MAGWRPRQPRSESLATLRLVRSLGDACVVVLGNHDIHLLAAFAGLRKPGKNDTLDEVLAAADVVELVDWLRFRPMAHRANVERREFLMVHAGLLPDWTAEQSVQRGQEIEGLLRADDWADHLGALFGDQPAQWSATLTGNQRLRCIINVLTRLRFCNAAGQMDFSAKEGAESAPDGFAPWFELRDATNCKTVIVTGHWSAVGLRLGPLSISTDSGCVWGGCLSAVRLEDLTVFSEPCTRFPRIGSTA